ncbi:ArsR/SmtB family transcription factor [Sinorhizobium psoraleae]|uniref:Metalloregulator ArsR/SmtB family transcription factor n=1 Tax=Sinorhizobium psoraleae TaxID=520838 RepID=A0ABT4KIJ5_9HYPH|nr:metalloregulator ArsR/SmtB family transcription factor [Sinorhizobium psoraleae]MCZ4091742.1 metalloregulator ArsR/SmtB family transcription factor [Sinorhizobium psoraleae]NRP70046.1 Transcriptional activator HlyU [Sinorhizobium psoraleae]
METSFDVGHASHALGAMAHAHRLLILELLLEREWSVGTLAVRVGLRQATLSQHLAKLRVAGVVQYRREAQTVLYSCRSDFVMRIMDALKKRR